MAKFNFNKLYQDARSEGKSLREYKNLVRQACGANLTEQGLVRDDSKQVLDPKHISFQELAFDMLGPSYREILADRNEWIAEASGGQVQPSSFINISGFDATAFGLLDLLVLEGYQYAGFIGNQFVTTEPTKVNGGKAVRTYFDDQVATSLEPGEEAPSTGLVQGYIDRPNNVRKGLKVFVTLESILYDHTDTIQQSAYDAGLKIGLEKEKSIAKMCLGVTNTYKRDGTSGNTFLTAKGSGVMNYKNSEANPLLDYTAIQKALSTLSLNTDPYSGIPIMVDPSRATLLVSVDRVMTVRAIMRATMVRGWTMDATINATYPVKTYEAGNPLTGEPEPVASPIWDAVNTAGSKTYFSFLYGNASKAFGYRELVPFQTVSVPLSPKEVTSNIALCVYAQEIGVPYVKEPRHIYLGTTQ